MWFFYQCRSINLTVSSTRSFTLSRTPSLCPLSYLLYKLWRVNTLPLVDIDLATLVYEHVRAHTPSTGVFCSQGTVSVEHRGGPGMGQIWEGLMDAHVPFTVGNSQASLFRSKMSDLGSFLGVRQTPPPRTMRPLVAFYMPPYKHMPSCPPFNALSLLWKSLIPLFVLVLYVNLISLLFCLLFLLHKRK